MSDSTNLHNPVLESGVIGACLTSPDALSETIGAGVQSADFHTPAHRLIWDAITALNDAGGAVDMPLVFNRLVREGNADAAGGPDAILGHAQETVVTPDRIGEYVLELRTLSVQRKLLEFGADAQKSGSDTLDVAGEISRLTDELAALQAAADIRGHDITIGAAIGQVLDWAEEVETSGGALLGPSFTLPDLDKLTRGLRRTEITLVAARPGMGKSLIAGQLALEAARGGYKTAFVSLEMSQLDLGKRFMSAEARMPTDKMEQGTMDDREWQMLSQAAARLDVLPMMIIDDAMTFGEIAARIERAERELDGLDLIIVDYLQLVELGERVESRQQEVSTVSRRLKLLAKKKNCAVLALSQLSRKVEERQDRRPILSDLRECLTGDTLVWRADTGARVPIKDLVDVGPVAVWSVDDGGRMVRSVMTNVWSTGTKPVTEIVLASGRRVRATDNHPFLGDGGWTKTGDLGIGDRLAVVGAIADPERPNDPDSVADLDDHPLTDDTRKTGYDRGAVVTEVTADGASELLWDPIVALQPAGEEETFDAVVPGTNAFIANDIVSHNSGALEQDAAAVVFLYRDEVYNPDSPDVGIVEFGLAKNRHGPIGVVSASFIPQHSMFKPLERRLAPPDAGGAF